MYLRGEKHRFSPRLPAARAMYDTKSPRCAKGMAQWLLKPTDTYGERRGSIGAAGSGRISQTPKVGDVTMGRPIRSMLNVGLEACRCESTNSEMIPKALLF